MSQQERISSQRRTPPEVPMHRSASSQAKRSRSPFAAARRNWDDSESSGSSLHIENEDFPRYPPREFRSSGTRRGMVYGHAETLGADDTEEEEEEGAGPVDRLPVRGKTGKFKNEKRYDPEKGARSMAGVPPRFSNFNRDGREDRGKAMSRSASRSSAGRAEFWKQSGVTSQMPSSNSRVATKGGGFQRERRGQNVPVRPSRAPVSICGNRENANAPKSTEEPVVRPKVRNLTTANCMKPKIFFDTDDDDDMPHSASRWREAANAEQRHVDGPPRRSRGAEGPSSYSEPKYPEDKRAPRRDQVKKDQVPRQRQVTVNPNFWAFPDEYYRYYDDDSDSDIEWISAVHHKFRNHEHLQPSGAENWATLPGNEEEHLQARGRAGMAGATAGASASASSSTHSGCCGHFHEVEESCQEEGQTSLEEGEIPWLQYNDNESSSEGDNESSHELMQAGVLLLDGNNNLEDDSSVSEDLEVDWSLFDGFADGLGVAEAISYVDPQFLTYMALEERLAQAMETALAHLESLAVDVEVANPPASTESIDALPEILVTEDHGAVGQEMCCPICCSEYMKGEVATELPCHHYFHKPCVSIWLQKSGTCPVCRCMFPPPL